MKMIIFLCLSVSSFLCSHSQYSMQVIISDSSTLEKLSGCAATLESAGKGNISNKKGFVQITNIPAGRQTIVFTCVGYEAKRAAFNFPLASNDTFKILIAAAPETLTEVIVQSTRTSRTFANTPTRVETIDGEELDEKNNMRPANVSMLLHESTGLQVQQTSATSGNASIRVQGLDGRYTQLLKDGYPNFSNFASGLSVLEIPPLDLKQVEVIKGPASTLYGGGAIAGVINFISKIPKEKAEYNLIINHSNVGQSNLGVYASKKKNHFGYAVLALANFQKAYDVDKDEFSELPKSNSFSIHPRFFYYPDARTTFMLGNSFTRSNNRGGDIPAIQGKTDSNHVYFEENNTIRNTTTFEAERKFQNNSSLKLKQSLGVFNRKINIPGYLFSGVSTNSFTDVAYLFNAPNHTLIAGMNFIFDKFSQKASALNQGTKSLTSGTYIQDTWDISKRIKIESGVRIDHVNYQNINYSKNQTFALPRISALVKIADNLSSRIGGGLGYKIPTIFTEQTETMQYQNVLPLTNTIAEKSTGFTADLNYRTAITNHLFFSLNQLFFFTQINKPLVLQKNTAGDYFFANAVQPVKSSGFETNLKFIFKQSLKLFAGYTYTNAKATYQAGNQYLALLPKDKLNLSVVYEKEAKFKVGLEGYLTGNQYLYNGARVPSFWEFGAMAEKTISKIALFINFENFTDQRQSKYKTVVNPPHTHPTFDDIWNHTEGFVVNGGVKIKL